MKYMATARICGVLLGGALLLVSNADAQNATPRRSSAGVEFGQASAERVVRDPVQRLAQARTVTQRAQTRAVTRDVSHTEAVRTGTGAAPKTEAAAAATPRSEAELNERMNANTVSVISGTPGGTYFRMASDMAFVLDDAENLRVLPILGKGAGQNAYDIRFLKGVDLGFVRTDTLDQIREDKRVTNIERHISFVAKLFNDELHVIASRDITDIRQLDGRKVTFDVKGSGTDYTGQQMFRLLEISVEPVNVDQPTALELLKKGEVAAVVSVAAKPVAVVAGFDPGDRYHFVPVPYTKSVAEKYIPATLTHTEYPRFVAGEGGVNTLAVATVLGVYNWPAGSDRYQRIARFVEAFFSKIDQFKAPQRHPKWKEVNIGAEVPGWSRFRAAQEWLDRNPVREAAFGIEFQNFMNERPPAPDVDKDRLYDAFMNWRRERGF